MLFYFFSPNLLCYFCKLLCNGTVSSYMYIVYTNHIQKLCFFIFFLQNSHSLRVIMVCLVHLHIVNCVFFYTNPICCQFYSSMLCPCVNLLLFELSFCIIFLLCSFLCWNLKWFSFFAESLVAVACQQTLCCPLPPAQIKYFDTMVRKNNQKSITLENY